MCTLKVVFHRTELLDKNTQSAVTSKAFKVLLDFIVFKVSFCSSNLSVDVQGLQKFKPCKINISCFDSERQSTDALADQAMPRALNILHTRGIAWSACASVGCRS